MRKIRRQKVICLFCMFLTAFIFFAPTLLQAETAEASTGSLRLWKECKSVDELETYLGTKYDPSDTSNDKWKEVRIIYKCTINDKTQYFYLNGQRSAGINNDPTRKTTHGYAYFLQEGMEAVDDQSLKTMENGYLLDTRQDCSVKFAATTTKASTSVNRRNQLTVQMKVSDGWSVLSRHWSYHKEMTIKYLDDRQACFGLKEYMSEGHYCFNFIGASTVAASAWLYDPYSTDDYKWVDYGTWNCYLDWRVYRDSTGTQTFNFLAVIMYPNYSESDYLSFASNAEGLQSSDTTYYYDAGESQIGDWFLIYLPVSEGLTMARTAAWDCGMKSLLVWDWKKYYEWVAKVGSTQKVNMVKYKQISGNYSLNAGETITYTGDVYIPSGTTLTIPEGSTLIIGSNCTVLCDGVIQNKGTLIIEPGALVSYMNRDKQNLNMVDTNIYSRLSDSSVKDKLSNRVIVYNKKGTSIVGVGTEYMDSSAKTKISDSAGKIHIALFKNGINNEGNLIVRKNAGVDIPRFTQSTSGKTWLYGTMDVEEIFKLDGYSNEYNWDTCTDSSGNYVSSMSFAQSNGIIASDSNFTIDEGWLSIFNWPTDDLTIEEDCHTDFWFKAPANWEPYRNRDVYFLSIPVMGNTEDSCFNLIGNGTSLKDYVDYDGIQPD